MQENMTRLARTDLKAKTDGIKVFIERHVWTKMHGWCRAANSEVSGLGLCYLNDDGHFVVYDVFLPKQKCSSGYTELDDDAVGKLAYYLHKKKKNQNHFRFWWHTHYNFNTFWSGTDDDNAQRLMKTNGEWELSLVINQKGNWLCRADFMKPVNVTFDELPVFLIPNSREHKRKRNFKSDIKKWVRPIVEPQSYNWKGQEFHRPASGYQAAWYQHWLEQEEADKKSKNIWDKKGSEDKASDCRCIRNGIYIYDAKCDKCNPGEKDDKKAVDFGKYVIFNGTTMTRERFEKIKACPCKHEGGWEDCECTHECDDCIERLSLHMGGSR